jgi:trimethylamine monooxygenase
MFDAQAWFARDIMMGRIALPDAAAVAADIGAWTAREEALSDLPDMIEFQADYISDLLSLTDYPQLDIARTAEIFKAWAQQRDADIVTYRDHAHPSVVTGGMAPLPATPWMQSLDDSLQAFLD